MESGEISFLINIESFGWYGYFAFVSLIILSAITTKIFSNIDDHTPFIEWFGYNTVCFYIGSDPFRSFGASLWVLATNFIVLYLFLRSIRNFQRFWYKYQTYVKVQICGAIFGTVALIFSVQVFPNLAESENMLGNIIAFISFEFGLFSVIFSDLIYVILQSKSYTNGEFDQAVNFYLILFIGSLFLISITLFFQLNALFEKGGAVWSIRGDGAMSVAKVVDVAFLVWLMCLPMCLMYYMDPLVDHIEVSFHGTLGIIQSEQPIEMDDNAEKRKPAFTEMEIVDSDVVE